MDIPSLFTDFMPHGHCFLWNPWVLWTSVVSDALIFLSYFSIPITLLYFLFKLPEIKYWSIITLFAAFILGCGFTHLVEIWNMWHGNYFFIAICKAITALLSVVTAIALVRIIPEALKFKSPEEHFKNESQLHDIENRFYSSFDYAPHGIGLVSPEGKWIEVNQRILDMTGYEKHELIGHKFDEITHPDDLKADWDLLEKVINKEIVNYQMEKRYYKKDGTIFWISLSVSAVFNKEGDVQYFVSQIQDIDNQKRLKHDADVFFNLASSGLAICDYNGNWIKVNQAFCDMLKFPKEKLLTMNFRDHSNEEDIKYDEEVMRQFDSGEITSKSWTKRYKTANGLEIWVVLTAKIHIDPATQEKNFICTFNDISQIKNLEEDLEHFTYSVAHDFKEPLRAIVGYNEMALDIVSDDFSKELIQKSIDRAYDLQQMTKDLMFYCESSEFKGHCKLTNIKELVNKVLSEFSNLKNVKTSLIVENEDSDVEVMQAALIQVLRNILSNAFKFCKSRVGVYIHNGDGVTIRIKDDGPGIDESFKEHIFKPFKKCSERKEGSGLGLALVKRICDKMGYNIELLSDSNGTEVIIKI